MAEEEEKTASEEKGDEDTHNTPKTEEKIKREDTHSLVKIEEDEKTVADGGEEKKQIKVEENPKYVYGDKKMYDIIRKGQVLPEPDLKGKSGTQLHPKLKSNMKNIRKNNLKPDLIRRMANSNLISSFF